jgi:hypothetical protein
MEKVDILEIFHRLQLRVQYRQIKQQDESCESFKSIRSDTFDNRRLIFFAQP